MIGEPICHGYIGEMDWMSFPSTHASNNDDDDGDDGDDAEKLEYFGTSKADSFDIRGKPPPCWRGGDIKMAQLKN